MSYAVTNDNGVIHVRATIESRAEMEQLAKALANAEKHLPEENPKLPTSAAEGAATAFNKEQPHG